MIQSETVCPFCKMAAKGGSIVNCISQIVKKAFISESKDGYSLW